MRRIELCENGIVAHKEGFFFKSELLAIHLPHNIPPYSSNILVLPTPQLSPSAPPVSDAQEHPNAYSFASGRHHFPSHSESSVP